MPKRELLSIRREELGGRVPYGRKFDFVKSSKAKWEVEKRMRC
jgi:hypothetical protein